MVTGRKLSSVRRLLSTNLYLPARELAQPSTLALACSIFPAVTTMHRQNKIQFAVILPGAKDGDYGSVAEPATAVYISEPQRDLDGMLNKEEIVIPGPIDKIIIKFSVSATSSTERRREAETFDDAVSAWPTREVRDSSG